MNKLRDMKNKGQLQKVELFPELKWYHKLWNRILVYVKNRIVVEVIVIKDWLKRVLYG